MYLKNSLKISKKKFIRHFSLLRDFRIIENNELLWLSTEEARKRSFIWGNKEIKNQYYLEKNTNKLYLKTMALTKFSEKCEGLPGFAHGGASCSVLDELTGVCCFANKFKCMTSNLNIEYIKPVLLNKELLLESEIDKVEDNKIFVKAKICDKETKEYLVRSYNTYKILKK